MKKKVSAVIAVVLIIISELMPGAFMLPAYAVSADNVDSYINKIFSDEKEKYNVSSVQKLLDGKYSETAGVSSDWFVYALMQYKGDSYNFSSYISALEKHVNGNNYDTATSKEKFALIFGAAGKDKSYISKVMNEDIGALGIMSNVYGLHLFNNGFTSSSHTSAGVIKELLSAQNDDGGWALSGTASDIDVTAMVIQSLAPHMSDADVKKAVNKGISFLSSGQLDNGGYKSYGKENPESAAQVIVALTSLGINPLTDSRFIKNSKSAVDFMLTFKASDYGYSHTPGGEYNVTATSQVLYALVSISLMGSGDSFYIYAKNVNVTETTAAATKATTQAQTTKSAAKTTAAASANSSESTTAKSSAKTTEKSTTAGRTGATRTTYASRVTTKAAKTTKTVTTAKASAKKTTAAVKETKAKKSPASETESVSETGLITEADTTAVTAEEAVTEVSPETTEKAKESKDTESESESEKSISPKVYIVSGIWALAVIAAAVLLIKKNKKAVNYIIIAAAGGVLTVIVALSNIQSPAEFYKVSEPESDNTITVTISITCDTVAGKGDESVTPSDGVILPETEVTLDEGSTVYDCLIKAAKSNKIQLEDNTQTIDDHSHAYIAGINNLYEFDYGDLSGWMYSVDGNFADVGCGEYTLSGGENIEWQYTCNLGDDLK